MALVLKSVYNFYNFLFNEYKGELWAFYENVHDNDGSIIQILGLKSIRFWDLHFRWSFW